MIGTIPMKTAATVASNPTLGLEKTAHRRPAVTQNVHRVEPLGNLPLKDLCEALCTQMHIPFLDLDKLKLDTEDDCLEVGDFR